MKKPLFLLALTLAAGVLWSQHGSMGMGCMRCRMMSPLPATIQSDANPITDSKVVLGRMLFYEPRLSKSQTISCNSCHSLSNYGVDSTSVSTGHRGQTGSRNSPTVYNAAGHVAQFWDGRAADVEEQAKGPVMNPVEMAMPAEPVVIAVLTSMPEYVTAFERAFPGDKNPVSFDNMAKAIGAFERKLTTPSRWDKYLRGDDAALTKAELQGWQEFMHNGCQTCHNGGFVGGGSMQKLGVKKAWPEVTDRGRYEVTKLRTDEMIFKVPSLRNIEKTGPYFHNGKVPTLDRAVKLMGEHQLGVDLSTAQVASIVTFLKALTGEIPQQYIRAPKLPKSTATTPKPDLSD